MNYTKLLVKKKRSHRFDISKPVIQSFHQMKQNKDQSLVCAEEQLRRVLIYYRDLIKDLILQGGQQTYFPWMSN